MYLKKLEIQGFKSFAHKSVLEFNPGITCVVGPNGSGKSNVADSIRWVMGEQSLKVLRGKKSEDVIFAGSDKKTRLSSAEVSLHIDNRDHSMPIDYDEVVITRRVYRDGLGEYLINKKPARLQDILLLLAKANFGQRTYSIIAQGMIDYFIMASPRERKELFDEAAGVRQYQIKRDQAILKLDHTKENLGQVEVLLNEISPRLRSLTRQVHRWERKEEIEKNLREKQIGYYNFLYQDIFQKHEEAQNNFLTLEKERQKVKEEIDQLHGRLEGLAKESTRGELFTERQKEYQKILDQKNSLAQEKMVLEGQMELDLVATGGSDLNYWRKKKEEVGHKLGDLRTETKIIEEKIKILEPKLEERIRQQKEILGECDKIEHRLKIVQEKMAGQEPLDFTGIKNELNQLYLLQQDFIKKISETSELEGLKTIKKEAEKIKERMALFLEKVKSSSPTSPKEIIGLQNALSEQIRKRDILVNEVNDMKVEMEVKREILSNRLKISQETENELAALDRQIERFAAGTKEEKNSRLAGQKKELEGKIAAADKELAEAQKRINAFNDEEQQKKDSLFALQKDFRLKQEGLNEIANKINSFKVELARFETKKEDLEHEVKEELPENHWPAVFREKRPVVEGFNKTEDENEILRLKHQIGLIGGIDENTENEYKETKERYDFLKTQSDDLNKSLLDLEKVIADLDRTIEQRFNQSFEKINEQFGKYFKVLFNGGQAKLSLIKEELKEDEEELEVIDEKSAGGGSALGGEKEKKTAEEEMPEAAEKKKKSEKVVAGVEIMATPPGKKLKNINMLSGGERALSSIALICAILDNNPSPFVVLDEVDAALDEANSIKFASIVGNLSKKSQFIVITHNRATMEKANILYGVTMGDDGVSKLLSIKMEEAEEVINQHGNR
ncbi:MAG: AAA family ATPase [Patescibacteria group bacterium]